MQQLESLVDLIKLHVVSHILIQHGLPLLILGHQVWHLRDDAFSAHTHV